MLALAPFCSACAQHQLSVETVNTLPFARNNQTIELSEAQLSPLGKDNLSNIHIRDAGGREVLCQAIDNDGDYHPDAVIFQSDFAPGQTKTFTAYVGKKHWYTKDQFRAYGRFNRERFGDFAWENDRIAHRAYGKALETWKEEPLTSSTIDVWCKKTPKLVINDWYMMDHYHADTGEGADLYSAGTSRGVGGNGLWTDGKLWVSKNFVNSRVLADGPIRVMFQLTYEAFDVNGNKVKEIKRVTLDAGQNLDHFQSFYTPENPEDLVTGIGIEKTDLTAAEVRKGIKPGSMAERHPGIMSEKDLDAAHGWLTTEQPLSEGSLNAAIIVNPANFIKATHDKQNVLILAKVPENNVASYWAGFSWSESGQFKSYSDWKTYINHFARGLESPIQVTVSKQ